MIKQGQGERQNSQEKQRLRRHSYKKQSFKYVIVNYKC